MSWAIRVDAKDDTDPKIVGWMSAVRDGKSDYLINLSWPQGDPILAFANEDGGGYRLSISSEYDGKRKWKQVGEMREAEGGFRINIYILPSVFVAEEFTRRESTEQRKPSW